jgi:hypothetical protein
VGLPACNSCTLQHVRCSNVPTQSDSASAAAAAAAAFDAAGEKATVWAFNFFFYNKKMKRILYLAVKAVSKAAADEDKVRPMSTLTHC